MKAEGTYALGLKDGVWKWFDRKGNVTKTTTFNKGDSVFLEYCSMLFLLFYI